MSDHRARQIFNCEHMPIKRAQQIYHALPESYVQMMRDLVNKPKPPFAVAVHNVESLVPFEELDDYL